MLQPSPVPATSFVERLRTGAGRRTLAISLALLIEGLMLLLLLWSGSQKAHGDEEEGGITVVHLQADQVSEEAPEPASPEPEQPPEERPAPQQPETEAPLPPQPAEPQAAPTPRVIIPVPGEPPLSTNRPEKAVRPAPPAEPVYGPADTGRSSFFRDTERVGTAPNGEPLYAAAWYREPGDEELRAYLSTARGPGWGLIACRTAPNYRVEDCVGLTEYPEGSQINRAVLAAAWEFRVRPPRRGGQNLVGAWVRIRIDYGIERR
ncbi:hypothetical protein [Sphingosinicella sp. CPCC 101087]|uniref:hypothetical protein n=1 Tax=Sphingosinicella sp. CPCC 101087 TaxID=2497754 RepID=UPI00101BD40D|nr:hypothetical protein [Sphingosinicella sp. CPCC 101087]